MGLPVFVIGALFGIVIGGLVGVFVGMATGAIIGITTVVFFYSPKEVFRYRLVMAAVSVIGASAFTYLGSLAFSDWLPKGTLYFVLPTVCAGVFAIPISQNLASWHINHKRIDS